MQYTKDIILSINEKEGINNERTSSIYKFIKTNRFILSLISITIVFMGCDILLVNTFIKMLTKI